ncbi:dihydrofolate reductase [Xylanibacillus composti]|uniref:Dihydrofolate reductase n=1 Tax=Xylanibacillus composti TaxID=1572762 RepID=A0A8J4H1I2_9BACL|nr:dihydrofolate reductase [Xylanibacillus composti]MDT9725614.1 dihydrofolate reductase [Xylanibacillus composti]GIQ67707.1 dihydrofolate reductase [Xylanibacillus composti]
MITMIFAMGRNRVIGRDNKLPWHLPADLQYFKSVTSGSTVVMGRLTHESIGRPLPNRRNIVITSDRAYQAEGCEIMHDIADIVQYAKAEEELFVIGGAGLFSQLLPYAAKMHITWIDEEFEGDTFLPEWDRSEWKLVSETPGVRDEKNPYHYAFRVYERAGN